MKRELIKYPYSVQTSALRKNALTKESFHNLNVKLQQQEWSIATNDKRYRIQVKDPLGFQKLFRRKKEIKFHLVTTVTQQLKSGTHSEESEFVEIPCQR